ncbi:MAG: phosphoserine aminotransferase [Pirellulaceae bacterium]|nr:MAG: phosphoserine aminotransferase [Pirellulaceae bacterium]
MTTKTHVERVYNFSAGPAVLPLPVLEQVQQELLALPGCGASILEISHRSKQFVAILEDAEQRLRQLLSIPSHYHVLFLQGGSRLQFSMVPMNLLRGRNLPARYILTGSWGRKAYEEAVREGTALVAWDGGSTGYDRVPAWQQVSIPPETAYVHITSNETIQGVQFPDHPPAEWPVVVCDASSDFLSRPIPVDRYGLIYACAQKNAGPAGVTIVLIRDDLVQKSPDDLAGYLSYRNHAQEKSLFNTPATFAIYIVGLVAKWLQEEIGGLEKMHQINREKAALLYRVLDESNGFYRGHAEPSCRSLMNVTFRLPDETLEKQFLTQAEREGLTSLKGHRSVGGIRASIYNAMPREGVVALAEFMSDFASRHAS